MPDRQLSWNSNPKWPWPCEEDISKYINVPDWYLVGYEEVRGFLRGLRKGRSDTVGKSAGGRPITAVYYGPAKPRRKLCIASSTHGTEVEGVSSVMNIINVLETGHDLRGRKWPAFGEIARKVGFYLVPFYNPDAAARSMVKSYVGMSFDAINHLHVGFWKNGRTLCRKRVFGPWTKESDVAGKMDYIGYLGQRFNDAGRLINRPCSRRRSMAVETMQMLAYLRKNRIDCYMDLHSHSTAPCLHVCPKERTSGDYEQLLNLLELTREMTKKCGGPDPIPIYGNAKGWRNNHFFPANLGIYAFTYEEKGGWKGCFPERTPFEEIWTANTYNGMYTILGLAQALEFRGHLNY